MVEIATSETNRNNAKLDELTIQLIIHESEILKSLFSQAETSAQSIFNFYLTLVTAITGGIFLLIQLAATSPAGITMVQIMILGLLLFAASTGSAYMSSLTVRYAHMVRYGHGMDDLRRLLLRNLTVPLPYMHQQLLKQTEISVIEQLKRPHPLSWFIPVGTYQLFVAAVSSFSWACAAWVLLMAGGIENRLQQTILIFVVTFLIYNGYARLMLRYIVMKLNVRVEM